MREIPLNVTVFCIDGECGKSSHIIIEQKSQKVTHFVVDSSSFLDSHKYLVDIEQVVNTTHQSIQLICTKEELGMMPPFTEMRFFNSLTSKYEPLKDFSEEAINHSSSYLMWSDRASGEDIFSMPIEEELIPAGEIAVHRGASVEATDGHIGRVDELIVDPDNQQVTHIVLQEGHLWHKKELTLPISAIARMDEDYIYLKEDKKTVKSLS